MLWKVDQMCQDALSKLRGGASKYARRSLWRTKTDFSFERFFWGGGEERREGENLFAAAAPMQFEKVQGCALAIEVRFTACGLSDIF